MNLNFSLLCTPLERAWGSLSSGMPYSSRKNVIVITIRNNLFLFASPRTPSRGVQFSALHMFQDLMNE